MHKNRLTNLPNAEERITVQDVSSLHIESYDIDNAYPQRIQNLVRASSTAKSCIALYAKFIRGGGFVNPGFYDSEINSRGLTPDKLLRRISADMAELRGVAIHFNYNQRFEKTEVNYIPFENVRKSKSSELQYHNKYAVCPHWYTNAIGKKSRPSLDDIDFIDKYDPRPEVIQAQVIAAGGWENYKGQVLYYSMDYDSYPLASCDAIIDEIKAEIASSRTTYNNLKNNFSDKTVFSIGAEFETESERQTYLKGLEQFVGPESNNVMLAEGSMNNNNEIVAPVIQKIPNTLNDKIFEYSDKKITRKILRSYNQPGVLHTDTDTNSFGKDDIVSATDFYNGITKDERLMVSELFKEIFYMFHLKINPEQDYSIEPMSYFNTIGGTDFTNLVEIMSSALTPDQKKALIEITFNISEEQAKQLAGITSQA